MDGQGTVSVIGFMQGRLSPPIGGQIQAFPWDHWRDEFPAAARLGFSVMEWTLDDERLEDNPLMTAEGQREIRSLAADHRIRIESVTGDFLIHASPVQVSGAERERRVGRLARVIDACGALGISRLVWPLVDRGRLTRPDQEEALAGAVEHVTPRLSAAQVRIAFESDYAPATLARLIGRFPADIAGINYDTGNSASLGFCATDEMAAYGSRVVNLHIKDRLLGGPTVPLGAGAADFAMVFRALRGIGYSGPYILQTARAADGDHAGALCRYRETVRHWISVS